MKVKGELVSSEPGRLRKEQWPTFENFDEQLVFDRFQKSVSYSKHELQPHDIFNIDQKILYLPIDLI